MTLLLVTQTYQPCYWCIFILMLGAFLIGYFLKDFDIKQFQKGKPQQKPKEEYKPLKPLGVIKTMERSGKSSQQ